LFRRQKVSKNVLWGWHQAEDVLEGEEGLEGVVVGVLNVVHLEDGNKAQLYLSVREERFVDGREWNRQTDRQMDG
jgi:hypothetical protein